MRLRFTLLLTLIFATCTAAQADQIADIDIETQSDPVQAVGLILGPNGTTQRADLKWTAPRKGIVSIQVPVSAEEQKQGSFVTAMILDGSGKILFGPMKSASLIESLDSLQNIPVCPGKKVPAGLETKLGELQLLIELRAQRRDNFQKRLGAKLSGALLEKIRTLETGFGLGRVTPLSAQLHPLELSDRLSRLASAIRSYKRQEAAAATAAARQTLPPAQ